MFAAKVAGCQVEIGASGAMAAAAVVDTVGGTADQARRLPSRIRWAASAILPRARALVFTHISSAEEVDNSTAIYGRFPP